MAKDSSFETQCVLASCHSLTYLDNDIVGDPLEKVSLKAIDWTLAASVSLRERGGRGREGERGRERKVERERGRER